MCECSAHLFFPKSVGGHTHSELLTRLVQSCSLLCWHFPPAVWLHRDIPATLSGRFTQHWLCTNLSLQASVEIKTHKCLPGPFFRSRTDAVCADLASEVFEKRGTFCRSTYTGCKCFKNWTWIYLSPKFPCRQVLCEFLELHCVTIMQVKEEKSA